MNKNILAIAVLSTFCGVANANGVLTSTIDIYQVADTREANTIGSGHLTIAQDGGSNANEVNLVQGKVIDNMIAITQTGAGHTANVVINAAMPGNNISENALAGGQLLSIGSFSNLTEANVMDYSEASRNNGITLSQTANEDVANISLVGSTNDLTLMQTADLAVANISVDGNYNHIVATQDSMGSVLNIASHGDYLNYTINQNLGL